MSWIWGTVQTSLDGRRTWNIFLEHTVVLSVIFRTSFPSDDFHFTQYRVYWKPMFTAWIVEQSQSRSNVHHWEIWCRVPQQPLDNLARNECTPCQHWGQLTTKIFKSVTNGSSLVTRHGSGTCQEPVVQSRKTRRNRSVVSIWYTLIRLWSSSTNSRSGSPLLPLFYPRKCRASRRNVRVQYIFTTTSDLIH